MIVKERIHIFYAGPRFHVFLYDPNVKDQLPTGDGAPCCPLFDYDRGAGMKCWSNGPGPSKQWIEMENVGLFQLQTMDGLKKQWMGSSSITPRNDSTSATHTHKNSPLGSTPPDIFINAIVTDH